MLRGGFNNHVVIVVKNATWEVKCTKGGEAGISASKDGSQELANFHRRKF